MNQKKTVLIIPLIMSMVMPGSGQLYMHRFLKGTVLFISLGLAIAIIWLSTSELGFKLFSLKGHEIYFRPSIKYLRIGVQHVKITDLMKVTGTLQLIITWAYGILDVFRERR